MYLCIPGNVLQRLYNYLHMNNSQGVNKIITKLCFASDKDAANLTMIIIMKSVLRKEV